MKIYLAGPMRGYQEFNFPAFHAAAARLRAQGHEVFNPAENDEKIIAAEGKEAITQRRVFLDDTAWICTEAEGIALLPGWRKSKGAKAEVALGYAIGIPVFELNAKTELLSFKAYSDTLEDIENELRRARIELGYGPMNSAHEGFAVLMEEVDELKAHVWQKQKTRDLDAMRKEAIEVGAMAVAFAAEVCGEERGRR